MFRFSKMFCLVVALSSAVLLSGCVTMDANAFGGGHRKVERTVASYEEAGRYFGEKHKKANLQPGTAEQPVIDEELVNALVDPEYLDFFWVHSELKEAFRKGYRIGYEDRTADFLLGPHFEYAAKKIGDKLSNRFVEVITTFEHDWALTLRKAVDVFIVLINEGSQADREAFIKKFTEIYSKKYNDTQARLKSGGFTTQVSESGSIMHIDMNKTQGALSIPSPSELKVEIYKQSFKVMGYEMSDRYKHNLITRSELIENLRKAKTAFNMDPKDNIVSESTIMKSLTIVQKEFVDNYGTDAENVFRDIAREAGYKVK